MEKDPPETVDRHRRMRGDGNHEGAVLYVYFYSIRTTPYIYEDVIIDSWWEIDFAIFCSVIIIIIYHYYISVKIIGWIMDCSVDYGGSMYVGI